MWVLFVISSVICGEGIETCKLKYTRYNYYQSQISCNIEMSILETTFISDERAICVKESDL